MRQTINSSINNANSSISNNKIVIYKLYNYNYKCIYNFLYIQLIFEKTFYNDDDGGDDNNNNLFECICHT